MLLKPEYIALYISIIAICVNVYISWRNRKYALAKEEYFKLKQIAEKIIAKLICIENDREKLRIFFQLSFKTTVNPELKFIDTNDTFNREDFEKEGAEVAAYIDIYFNDLKNMWNDCLDRMSQLFTITFIISKHIEERKVINWKTEADKFNTTNQELGHYPEEIGKRIKKEINNFKEKNLDGFRILRI